MIRAVALLSLLPAFPLAAQESQPADSGNTFSVDVKVVNVWATVKDRNGQLLTDLDADDFVLWEDGFVQQISYFSYETDVPLSIGLLVDTSMSQVALIPVERRTGLQFFRTVLRPESDRAFLISFGQEVELLRDFTGSLSELHTALDDLHANPVFPRPEPGAKMVGTALYDALFLAAEEMFRSRSGRKVAVIVSDGFDMGSAMNLARAVDASLRSDVVVYAIQYLDSRFAKYVYRESRGAGEAALRRMAEVTGGAFFRVTERLSLGEVFGQIEDEMRGVYSIGYVPKKGLHQPGYRQIKVTSPRTDIKTIQARDGYYPEAIRRD